MPLSVACSILQNFSSRRANSIDDPATYHRLRAIKKAVDPNDVFQSRFTVRPAED